MTRPFLIFSQSDYLIQIVATDLDLHFLQRQGISGFSMTRVNYIFPRKWVLTFQANCLQIEETICMEYVKVYFLEK